MRLRICSTQLQALTQETETLVKQAINLATRRGHSQVTPLHLATIMLSNPTSLLHKACLQCHSHPLQFKALEICFNVSLNRLPGSTISSPQYSSPSLSNSLIATFKRAQGHQRRATSIESQQQSILALKIEVQQLIISILDDPCISRVMREAGFSSTFVKTKVEQALISHSKDNTYKPQVHGGNDVSSSRSFNQPDGSIDHFTTCVGSLNLTLSLDSNFQAQERSKVKFKDESFEDGVKVSKHIVLPTWLQNCKEERVQTIENQKNAKQWNKECELYTETESENISDDCIEGNLIMFMPQSVPKQDFLSNPNSSPNSASSSDEVDGLKRSQMLNELNDENMKILCDALEKKVPNQKKTLTKEIASTVLLCRSGMRKGGDKDNYLVKRDGKQETWMLFLGDDSQPKELISKELAKVVFGSYNDFVTIGISSFSCKGSEESKKKRLRDEFGSSYMQRFGEAMNENPHRVFYMEDFEQVDYFTQKGIRKAIENGSITLPCGGESLSLKDAIVIFSCETSSSYVDKLEEKKTCLSLDLNIAIEVDEQNVHLIGDFGVLELVDKQINFKTQEQTC
ncbi:protein SMAX1-LIKE 3 [Lathyrus oleraceus]|uniref:Clp R domain-containing protein n=2 Tax=Pisum sativum TaxID=3888 RepID=A0A9D4W5A4_PEA|nr:protein SMAX1-LIKE 3-like [Pisum sativum]KAI5394660.1 hypothetical protein KIW84_061336 [Pisum sativum]